MSELRLKTKPVIAGAGLKGYSTSYEILTFIKHLKAPIKELPKDTKGKLIDLTNRFTNKAITFFIYRETGVNHNVIFHTGYSN